MGMGIQSSASFCDVARNRAAEPPRRAMRFVLLGMALVFVGVPEAHAYRTAADLPDIDAERVAWGSTQVSLGFDAGAFEDGSFLRAVDRAEAERALAASVATWNEVRCSSFEFVVSTTPDVVIRAETDWESSGYQAGAAATTDVGYRIGTAEAFINNAELIFNVAAFARMTAPNFEAVLTHELGHVLGLLHPCEDDCTPADEGAALHPIYRPSQVMLGSDDIDGLCFLYPAECEGPACDLTCREVDSAEASDECPWLGDPCSGEAGSLCAYGRCASDGYCSLSCETARDCSGRQACTDGLCVPERVARYGESCERGNGCLSLLCVTVADGNGGEDSMCTRGCDGIPCPGDDTCSVVDDQAVCTPLVPASGCSLGRVTTSAPTFALGIFFLFAWIRRKRTSPAN